MPKDKGGLMDFITDQGGQHLHDFCQMVDDEKTKPEALCQTLVGWGYTGVSVKDCTTILFFRSKSGVSFQKQFEKKY